jgi:hypothetical protein
MAVTRNGAHVRLVECPFCGFDLRGANNPPREHLRQCEAFREAWR